MDYITLPQTHYGKHHLLTNSGSNHQIAGNITHAACFCPKHDPGHRKASLEVTQHPRRN